MLQRHTADFRLDLLRHPTQRKGMAAACLELALLSSSISTGRRDPVLVRQGIKRSRCRAALQIIVLNAVAEDAGDIAGAGRGEGWQHLSSQPARAATETAERLGYRSRTVAARTRKLLGQGGTERIRSPEQHRWAPQENGLDKACEKLLHLLAADGLL